MGPTSKGREREGTGMEGRREEERERNGKGKEGKDAKGRRGREGKRREGKLRGEGHWKGGMEYRHFFLYILSTKCISCSSYSCYRDTGS